MIPTARVVVIGAGIGGLTAAPLLAREGVHVTVVEANPYPGGSAAARPRGQRQLPLLLSSKPG
ncbi:MAG: FAD-dependent oxidoreductase [Chloroflexi bacterium]|nr:FAD-dependent oxidoreductase [Chloroflexota bacterium]